MSDISDAIKKKIAEIESAAEQTLQDAGKFAREEALATDLFKVSESFKDHTQFTTLDKFNGFVRADRPWAQYLEFGNNQKGPFITPVNAKVLHFQIGGRDIFTKKVRTHGPLPFMENAGKKLEDNIEGIFIDNLNKTLT